MNRYIPLIACLVLASGIVLTTPVQVYAMTFQYTTPQFTLPLPNVNSTGHFLMDNFALFAGDKDEVLNVTSIKTDVYAKFYMTGNNTISRYDIDYNLHLSGVKGKYTKGNFTFVINIDDLTLIGYARASNGKGAGSMSVTAPLWAIIKERFV